MMVRYFIMHVVHTSQYHLLDTLLQIHFITALYFIGGKISSTCTCINIKKFCSVASF